MNKKHGLCCIILGTALLIAALSLVFYNSYENKRSGESVQEILSQLKEGIPEPPTEPATEFMLGSDLFGEYETAEEAEVEEPTMMVDEHGYIGILSLPDLGLELPVMSEWNYVNLRYSPCRYKGTIAGKDLIIAAHNYRSHFGTLQQLSGGELVIFTAADGSIYEFEVSEVIELNGKDIEGMDFGSSKLWDMTLFTCTLGGQSRVTVRCKTLEEEN